MPHRKKNSKTSIPRKGTFIIKDLTWSMSVTFIIGYDSKYVGNFIKKKTGTVPADVAELDLPSATGRTYWRDGSSSEFFIYLKHWPEKVWHYGTLHHELFHVVDRCLRGKGIILSDDSDEAYAYLTEALTRDIYMKL